MNELVQFGQTFDFKIRRDHEKISYERRAYESVDSKIYEKNNSGHKGLKLLPVTIKHELQFL